MQFSKRRRAGRDERSSLLVIEFGDVVDSALGDLRSLGCAADDLLDAFAALWTARRIAKGTAVILPALPPRDKYGLPMEMVA
jgi:predicted RNase H-like nuclease